MVSVEDCSKIKALDVFFWRRPQDCSLLFNIAEFVEDSMVNIGGFSDSKSATSSGGSSNSL